MKKSFPLTLPGRDPARVIEAIKSDVRKYLKRERAKSLPEGVDFWDFTCRAGTDPANAVPLHVADLTTTIDRAAAESWPTIYLEILATPGHRTRRNPG